MVVAVVFLAAVLYGSGDAVYENPHPNPATAIPPTLSIRLLGVNWNITGCEVSNLSTSARSVNASSTFSLTAKLTNPSTAGNCTVYGVEVRPSSFGFVNGTLPLLLVSGASTSVTIRVAAPAFQSPVELSLLLTGS